ncbi:MAG: type II toxin-antitoxin system VapC family toxin [Acidobacteriota bacterium]
MIIADTNLISYLLIEGPFTEVARQAWQRDACWLAPPLWRSELLNVLWLHVRVDGLREDDAFRIWRRAVHELRLVERSPDEELILQVALRDGISAYDAHFVAVAEREGLPLVTADKTLLRRCPAIAQSIESFAENAA